MAESMRVRLARRLRALIPDSVAADIVTVLITVRMAAHPSRSASERALARALREEIAALPPLGAPSAELSTERQWLAHRQRIREHILQKDPRTFLRWRFIRDTMFPSDPPFLAQELAWLQSQTDWASRWMRVIRESRTGSPSRYPGYPASSGNLLHHAYIASQFETHTATQFEHIGIIVEFGGGYGNMSRVIRRMGFRGIYIIFDLPEFSALQRYFLTAEGYNVQRDHFADPLSDAATWCLTQIPQITEVLRGRLPDLVIATWSLSEAPISLRDQFLAAVASAHQYLFTFQNTFSGIDNVSYFADWASSQRELVARLIPISHWPDQSRFLIAGARSR